MMKNKTSGGQQQGENTYQISQPLKTVHVQSCFIKYNLNK